MGTIIILNVSDYRMAPVHRPRLLLVGSSSEQAQSTHLAPAVLHRMEHVPIFTLDLGTMYEVSARSPEETVSQVCAT